MKPRFKFPICDALSAIFYRQLVIGYSSATTAAIPEFKVQGSRFRVQGSKLLLLLGLWTLDCGLWTFASAQQTNTPDRFDYSSFKIITDRNIFNSHRSARYRAPRESGPQARVDSFALVGTMSYEKGPFAFFDGTSSEYRKALKVDERIAGFKVADIEPAYVKLASPSNEIELAVGMELRREDKGQWRLSARPDSPAASSDRSAATRPAVATPAAPATGPSTDASNAESIVFVDPETQLVIREPLIEAPGSNAAPGTATGGSDGDILERLRRRREQESQ